MKFNNLRVDSQKLIYHVSRVHEWLQGKDIYPIYIEISLFAGCNHRCIFCAFDFLQYKPYSLDESCLKRFILEASKEGLKSILYSGEGEPLLHEDAADIIVLTKKAGIDVAVTTNGVLLDKEMAKRLLGHLSWIRMSLNAGAKKTYSIIHGTKKDDFNIVINNIKEAVKIRNKNKYSCTIGVQFLLLPQNYKEIVSLVQILTDIGVDYLIIKPYSQHPLSFNKIDPEFKYRNLLYLKEKLKRYSKKDFQIIFRQRAMEKISEKKPYKYCLGLPFAAHITAEGDVYPCNNFIGKKEFIFGNICNEAFGNIRKGKTRNEIMDRIFTEWDTKNCRKSCRIDEINRYLWELINPINHVNFI